MPGYVVLIDIFGLVLAALGFNMAFRQAAFRRAIGKPRLPVISPQSGDEAGDPLTYALRLAGVMVMIFGIVIAGMFTLFNLLIRG
ncbi:MAG TPA: hypothetical protein VF503_06235 [Sphingobium sp.]|uniref:hypothetical protein n=1 Tax=Sphingobium sp. TaxID=1912891 RepID=UPI002ED00C06